MKYTTINNVKIAFENIKDTPRTAIYLYLATDKEMKSEGVNVILGNLLLQGTKTKTAEEIARGLENLGVEILVDSRADFLKVSIICLNEDIEPALDIVADFMVNSTFDSFDKEVFKFKGEAMLTLDSPVSKASDYFHRELFKNHKYGITNTVMLESIDKMTVDDVKDYYSNLLSGNKIISIASDVEDENTFLELIANKLSFMKQDKEVEIPIKLPEKPCHQIIKIKKEDAKQAQIFQGWIVPGINSPDCAGFFVLNNILGASGLSSRLFVELRDKRGLAYTVRSSYKTLKNGAYFVLYIGTEPSNIKKSLEGFKSEIQRLIDEPPTEIELQGAIENCIGKYKYFFTQTNSQIANSNGWCAISGLDFDYNEKVMTQIKNVTSNEIVEIAKKYLLNPPVTAVLAPSKYLEF